MDRKGTRSAFRWPAAAATFAVLVSLSQPASAATPPVIRCMEAYGHEVPAAACDPNPNQLGGPSYAGKVYPNSLLYPTGPIEHSTTGSIFVEGNATPGATIFVTVSDGARTLGPFQLYANLTGNEGGPRAGDFAGEIMVAELGNHIATPNFDNDAVGDDELGPDLLFVRAWPVNGDGAGAVATDTVVKHAATHGDTFAPKLSEVVFPPLDLDQSCKNRSLARTYNGTADALALPGVRLPESSCPYYPIAGTIRDLDATTAGTASEVSDVRIVIRKEAFDETYLDVRHSNAFLPAGRGQILTRTASNVGRFNYLLNIQDLPANDLALVGLDDVYTVTVTVCDAWGDVGSPNGNCATASQGDIIVHSQ